MELIIPKSDLNHLIGKYIEPSAPLGAKIEISEIRQNEIHFKIKLGVSLRIKTYNFAVKNQCFTANYDGSGVIEKALAEIVKILPIQIDEVNFKRKKIILNLQPYSRYLENVENIEFSGSNDIFCVDVHFAN